MQFVLPMNRCKLFMMKLSDHTTNMISLNRVPDQDSHQQETIAGAHIEGNR